MRVVIADDERRGRERLRDLLATEPDVDLVAAPGDGLTALQAITDLQPDVAFLDIQMPGLTGFEVVAALSEDQRPLVVFVTAYDAYALRAFDVCAVDYLLKPVEGDRLTRTLRTLRVRHGRANVTRLLETVAPAPPLRRVVGRHLRRWHVLPVDDIEAFVADDGLVFAVTARGRFLVDRTLRELQATLSAERFVRVHKRAIVNLDALIAIDPIVRGGGNARLTSGQVIPISRRCAATLRARLRAVAVDPIRRRARRDTQVP